MKTRFPLIRLAVLLLGSILAATTAGGFPTTASRSGRPDQPSVARTFKYSIGATNLVFTLRPNGLVIEEPAFSRSGVIRVAGGAIDEARLVDFLRAVGIEDARIRERLAAIKGRIRDNLGLQVTGRASFRAGEPDDLEPAGPERSKSSRGGDRKGGGRESRAGGGEPRSIGGEESVLESESPQGRREPESLADLIDRGVRLSASLRGDANASIVFREAGERLRTAQVVMARSQAFLGGPASDEASGLAIKEELANSRESLEDSIKDLEGLMDGIRDSRHGDGGDFENSDQKVSQLVNILSTVLKTEKEIESEFGREMR